MSTKIRYEYDAEREVLIKCSSEKPPEIIRRCELVWRSLDDRDEQYARAIFFGQGCWERLDTITEEKALCILKQWELSSENE